MIPTDGAALIRVAAYPNGLTLPPWPDLTSDQPEAWRDWLRAAWTLPAFAPAVVSAAPRLAEQISRAVDGAAISHRQLRRLVDSTIRYLLRWTTRATPFGTFAGVAPVEFGARAAVRWGEAHREVARPDSGFIAEQIARAEKDLAVLRTAAVVTNSLGHRRGGVWVIPCARTDGDRRWDAEIRLTDPIETALQEARLPVMFTDLAARIAGPMPDDAATAERLLAALIQAGALVSQLRPATSVTDPAAHLSRFCTLPDPGDRVTVDLRVDVSVTLPPSVLHEAGRAASTLVAVAPHLPGWSEYHHAFIARWGPGAAVPVRDVLNVLGFPAGYRGSHRREPAVFTDRDRLLAHLAQQSTLDGYTEVVLDDELIDRLRGDDDRSPVPHTELRFTLAAATLHDLDRGDFTLTVVSGARHAGVAAGRLLHLLTPAELASFQRAYQILPTALPGADAVQLSGPPLEDRLVSVARVPELLPVLPVGDFHPRPEWTVEDLAVCGDGQRLWLVSQHTGRPIEPLLFNAVLLPGLQQPLMRFLTEIWAAWNAPCSPFDFGHASGLPFLPRVRRGRSILHPARWIVDKTTLPARTASWAQWRDAWQRRREQHRIPDEVLVGDDDVRLRLDLNDSTHLAVLRGQLDRQTRTVVTEAPGPAGWIGDRPAEILLTLSHAQSAAARPARAARAAATVAHRPGRSRWLEAHLYGRADAILTDLVRRCGDHLPTGWWFLRYPDPEPHLRLRIPVGAVDQFADVAGNLAGWASQLEQVGLLYDYTLHTYRPETRHGTRPETLAAAEAVFAADSRTALHRLTTSLAGDRQAATAAGMIAIADGFTGDGLRWLAEHVPHRSGPRLEPRQMALARDPYRDDNLAATLSTYHTLVDRDGIDADVVLADLLHLHHARMIGVDSVSERHCLRLARAVARAVAHGDVIRAAS